MAVSVSDLAANLPLGSVGDIILADLSQYAVAVKTDAISADTSMHFYFDQNLTAFRFIMRVAGQSLWRTPVTRQQGGTASWAAWR